MRTDTRIAQILQNLFGSEHLAISRQRDIECVQDAQGAVSKIPGHTYFCSATVQGAAAWAALMGAVHETDLFADISLAATRFKVVGDLLTGVIHVTWCESCQDSEGANVNTPQDLALEDQALRSLATTLDGVTCDLLQKVMHGVDALVLDRVSDAFSHFITTPKTLEALSQMLVLRALQRVCEERQATYESTKSEKTQTAPSR